MSRLNLKWGGGNFDVVFDIKNKLWYQYSNSINAVTVHEALDGKNYYISRTGCTGAGWISKKPGLFKVAVYRTDDNYDHIWAEKPNVGEEWTVTVPIDYCDSTMYDYPAIVYNHYRQKLFIVNCDAYYIANLLTSDLDDWQKHYNFKEWSSYCFTSPSVQVPYCLQAWVHNDCKVPSWLVRRLIANSSFGSFGWQDWIDNEATCHRSNFFMPLGYRVSLDWQKLYKVRQGLCQGVHDWDEDGLMSIPDNELPSNVVVYAPDFYIQEQKDGSAIAHIISLEMPEYEYEVSLNSYEWLKVLASFGCDEWQKWHDKCLEGLSYKIESDAENRRKQEAIQQFNLIRDELIKQHADFAVTRQHSLDAGNCQVGTDRFINEKGWQGQEAIALGELAKYDRLSNVRRVVDYVLLSVIKVDGFESLLKEPSESYDYDEYTDFIISDEEE